MSHNIISGDLMTKPNQSVEDFMAEYDIVHNQRRHNVPCLRFIKEGESTEVELLRNDIWDLFLQDYSIRHIAAAVDSNKSTVGREIQTCKKLYDEWVTKNGLSLHGDPANRLEDTIASLDEDLLEIRELCKECKDNEDVRGYTQLKTLENTIRKEKAKYMGIEPPKTVNVNMTSAEETRKKMEDMFPTEKDDVKGEYQIEEPE